MKRESILLVVVLGVWGLCIPVHSAPWEGAGTAESPYLIYDANDMQAIGADSNYWDAHFKLVNDINLAQFSGEEFNIIGNNSNAFTGVFDGNNHTIHNFSYTCIATDDIGLFGVVYDPNAKIKNLCLRDPNVDIENSFSDTVGSLVGWLIDGTIIGCGVKGGNISGIRGIGGLVGCNYFGTIEDCWATTTVSGTSLEIGGIIGRNLGVVRNCYAGSTVVGETMVGGLAGKHGSSASVGTMIEKCYSVSNVKSTDDSGGGLVGFNQEATIQESYAAGVVDSNNIGGGLVGYNWEGTISNCYSLVTIDGNSFVGGLVGAERKGTIENCYAAGEVSGDVNVGGLVGAVYDSSSSFVQSFWDNMVNPLLDGIGNATDPNVIGKPTTEMQMESTFTAATWDFFYTWDILEGTNYPQLAWEVVLSADIDMDELWMYQNVLSSINSRLTADVFITDDPWDNSSYTYDWEIILPDDVSIPPTITASGGFSDPCCTFAAPSCNEPNGLSDSGQAFTVRVTVTGDQHGNTGEASAEFGIALLGDVNNDEVVNVADRAIINAFWRLGAAGPYTFTDCDINCDGAVNVADRAIANAVWRGVLGQNRVTNPCPLR